MTRLFSRPVACEGQAETETPNSGQEHRAAAGDPS